MKLRLDTENGLRRPTVITGRGRCVLYLALVGAIVVLFAIAGSEAFGLSPRSAAVAWADSGTTDPDPSSLAPATTVMTYHQLLPIVLSGYEPPVPTLFGVQLYYSIEESATALSLLRGGRAHWARWPMSWARVEPTNTVPESYNWYMDGSIRNAQTADLELMVTIKDAPNWAATYANGPIDKVSIDEFTEFVGALVERYDGDGVSDAPGSPQVRYWEFYNEPDAGDTLRAEYGLSYWGPFGTQYAEMLCAVYPVMKAASPEAQLVFGGIAYDNFLDGQGSGTFVRGFLQDVLAAGGASCFDVMNFHYYPPFEPNWAAYGPGLSGKAAYLRQTYNLGEKPMVVTEAGWASDSFVVPPSSPQVQARYVVQLFTQAIYADVKAMIWWTWIDPDAGYGSFGLLSRDLEPKPSYDVYREAALRLGLAKIVAKLSSDGDVLEVYHFLSASERSLYVLWSRDAAIHSTSLPLSGARVSDMYGDTLYEVTDASDGHVDGRINISVGPDPIYVEALP